MYGILHFFSASVAEAAAGSQSIYRSSSTVRIRPSVHSPGLRSSTDPVYGDPQLYYQPSELHNVRSRRLFWCVHFLYKVTVLMWFFFITAKTKCDHCLQWCHMSGCEKEWGDSGLPLWNFIEMFAFCESKIVKYKHCILSLYIFSGIGSLITKTYLCHKSKK
jgi:hypothetical protein